MCRASGPQKQDLRITVVEEKGNTVGESYAFSGIFLQAYTGFR